MTFVHYIVCPACRKLVRVDQEPSTCCFTTYMNAGRHVSGITFGPPGHVSGMVVTWK